MPERLQLRWCKDGRCGELSCSKGLSGTGSIEVVRSSRTSIHVKDGGANIVWLG